MGDWNGINTGKSGVVDDEDDDEDISFLVRVSLTLCRYVTI